MPTKESKEMQACHKLTDRLDMPNIDMPKIAEAAKALIR